MMVNKGKRALDAEQQADGDQVTFEQIAARAHEIHLSGTGEGAEEDWLLAERQLHAQRALRKGTEQEEGDEGEDDSDEDEGDGVNDLASADAVAAA